MFDKTQYVIEEPTTKALRDIYTIKDANGTLLGYSKKQMLGKEIRFLGRTIGRMPNFLFEGTDGTRLGEIRGNNKKKKNIRGLRCSKSPSSHLKTAEGDLAGVADRRRRGTTVG